MATTFFTGDRIGRGPLFNVGSSDVLVLTEDSRAISTSGDVVRAESKSSQIYHYGEIYANLGLRDSRQLAASS